MQNSTTREITSPLERLRFTHVAYAYAVAYALHIVEEFPRFITWTHSFPEVYGGKMTQATFWAGDALFITYIAICLLLMRFRYDPVGIVAALSIPFWAGSNAIKHISMTLITNTYSPGVITAAGLYLSLGVLLLDRAANEGLLNTKRVLLSMAIGFGVQFGVLSLGHLV